MRANPRGGLIIAAALVIALISQVLVLGQSATPASAPGSTDGAQAPNIATAVPTAASVSTPEPPPSPAPSWREGAPRRLPQGAAESVGMDGKALANIDQNMDKYVVDGLFPGAVVLVARKGVIVKETAYGNAAVFGVAGERLPQPIPAQTGTIFDLASLSKLFTTTAALVLVDRGQLNLDATVARYLPEFAANGKDQVTVRQLLTHTAGLPPGLALWSRGATPAERLRSAYGVKPQNQPGSKYVYSDGGPIFVGQIVERITRVTLDKFVEQAVLAPLGLVDTQYNPPAALRERIAATEKLPDGKPGVYWGSAQDGEARALNGVAGNAGLFGTADEVAVLAEMMREGGALGDQRLLSAGTVAAALQPQPGTGGERGVGWELSQSWYMGSQAAGSFGHTGYTGTSVVVNPKDETVVVLLTNSLHPKSHGSTNPARVSLANTVHAAILR
ncbi:MAG: serine hydrolase domain-containing protein [Chloroflexota bacterium]